MVWPVFLQTTVITDQRNALRLTDYVTVHAAVATPPRKMVADYKGRPVTKAYLLWMRHLKLHSHALNDGEWGAYDGRRKCNGIFDMAYYKKFRQVQSNPNSSFKHRWTSRSCRHLNHGQPTMAILFWGGPDEQGNRSDSTLFSALYMQVGSLVDSSDLRNGRNAVYKYINSLGTSDFGGSHSSRTTLVQTVKPLQVGEQVLVFYGSEYKNTAMPKNTQEVLTEQRSALPRIQHRQTRSVPSDSCWPT
jgi:hypothetical protein